MVSTHATRTSLVGYEVVRGLAGVHKDDLLKQSGDDAKCRMN